MKAASVLIELHATHPYIVVLSATLVSTDTMSPQVRAGPKWREVLLCEDTTAWLLDLLPVLSGAEHPERMGTPLAAAARELLTKFASIAGDIFPKATLGAGGEQKDDIVLATRKPRAFDSTVGEGGDPTDGR